MIELSQLLEKFAGVRGLGKLLDQGHRHGDVNQVFVSTFDDNAHRLQFGRHGSRIGRRINDQRDAHLVFLVEQSALLGQGARSVHPARFIGQDKLLVHRAKRCILEKAPNLGITCG